jgi:6-phosphogluconolactonase
VSTLPDGFSGHSTCAEVQIAPSGRFLYGSNRGHNSIVVYAIGDDGCLTAKGHVSTQGEIPRNFEVSADGRFLAVANQDTNNIVMFRIDQDSGQPVPTGNAVEVGTPVCVRFVS